MKNNTELKPCPFCGGEVAPYKRNVVKHNIAGLRKKR